MKTKPDKSLSELRKSMIKDGAVPNFEGATYLFEGVWIYPDGTLSDEF